MAITLPIHIEFREWASQIRIDLPDISIPVPPDVKDWKGWASQVVSANALTNVPLPTEHSYTEEEGWRTWASYFVGSVYN